MENTLTSLFILVDDFCKKFMPEWEKSLLTSGLKKRKREGKLNSSEIMTIYIHFHQSHFRDFKNYYINYVSKYMQHLFPNLVSYNRFVALIKSVLVPLCFFLQSFSGEKTGIYFIDSTIIKACHIKRNKQHKVFKGIAKVDDRKPVVNLVKNLIGKLFADKGYISQELFDKLYSKGLQLVTYIKKNMKNKFMPLIDRLLLRKRALIECVNDQLKNISQIEHTRHRSIWNFAANILAALCAYVLQPKKTINCCTNA